MINYVPGWIGKLRIVVTQDKFFCTKFGLTSRSIPVTFYFLFLLYTVSNTNNLACQINTEVESQQHTQD